MSNLTLIPYILTFSAFLVQTLFIEFTTHDQREYLTHRFLVPNIQPIQLTDFFLLYDKWTSVGQSKNRPTCIKR